MDNIKRNTLLKIQKALSMLDGTELEGCNCDLQCFKLYEPENIAVTNIKVTGDHIQRYFSVKVTERRL